MSMEEDVARYHRALHALQSGVAAEQERGSDDGTPKQLRTGVNSALVNSTALGTLLIEKGLITEAEYVKVLADGMEAEVARYEERLSEALGANVRLH